MKLGKILKETRIKHGITLSEVAKELLIQEIYVEAIEDGYDDRLPSGTYKRIYTRAYCRLLGVEFKEDKHDKPGPIAETTADSHSDGKKPAEMNRTNEPESLELDLPFDTDRAFRICYKLIASAIVIFAIIKFFMWIFNR